MTEATVGHTLTSTIAFFDAKGNPMLTTPVPDSPPVWAQTTPATETMVVSADGLTDVTTLVAPGTDVLSVNLTVGGTKYSATNQITADAQPQALTSIQIVTVVSG